MASHDQKQKDLVNFLFIKHTVRLRGYLRGLTADAHSVDDLVNDTYLTVLDKAGDFERGTNFRAWVFTIARFKVLAAIRDAGRKQETMLAPEVIEKLCAEEPTFSKNEERERHIQVCMEKLAPQARRAMELRFRRELSAAETAAAMGWTTGAMKVALSRACAAVRECIEWRLTEEAA